MQKFSYVIKDKMGIHLKLMGCLAKEAGKYESEIQMVKDSNSVAVKEPLAMIGLRVQYGDTVEIEIKGADEDAACDGMKAFFENNL